MTARPLVSVVIPSYNYARFLPEAIDSVLRQSYCNVETIVVDDGSTDDSKTVIEAYGDAIRFVSQENGGVSRARNRGMEESRGELVAFLDADDAWSPDKLERQVELLLSGPFGMVYCGLEVVGPDGRVRGWVTKGLSGRVLGNMALLTPPGVPASGSSALIWRKVLDQVGGFDTELSTSADWDMWRRIACRYEIGFLPDPLVRHRVHDDSMHRSLELFERDMLLAFEKMFADEAAREARPIFRRARGRLYWTLAGSFFRRRRWSGSARYLAMSLFYDPSCLARLAGYPLRRLGVGSASGLTPEGLTPP